jgi:hypothetical protein
MPGRSDEITARIPQDRAIVGVEVGVRYGKNAEQVLIKNRRVYLWLVDTWAKPPAGDSYYNSGDSIADRPPGYWRKCYRQFEERMAPYLGKFEIKRMTSAAAAHYARTRYAHHYFDFVFIDADHSYEGAKRDIELWYDLIAPGGWIGGHDYNHPRIGEVKRSVDERFGNQVDLGRDYTWFVRV